VHYDHKVQIMALVPARSESRFVHVAKSYWLFELNQLKPLLPYSFENTFFEQKKVRVCH
jgi:hypothetical protein